MGFLSKLLGRDKPKQPDIWQPPQEGAIVPPGFRPAGWEYPPKKPGDSDIVMVAGTGEPGSKPVFTRIPEAEEIKTVSFKPTENRG